MLLGPHKLMVRQESEDGGETHLGQGGACVGGSSLTKVSGSPKEARSKA